MSLLKKRNSKYSATKTILKVLDGLARKHGLVEVRHAANKWATAQRERASLAKQRKALEQKLAEVSRRLS